MAERYFAGEIKATPNVESAAYPEDEQFFLIFRGLSGASVAPNALQTTIGGMIESLDFKAALELIWRLLDSANKYIVTTSPFTLAKDSANLPRVAQILANLVEALRVTADNLEPFMPITSAKILDLLNVDEKQAHAPYGHGIARGHRIKPTTPLFPRIDKKARANDAT
jgi:methionyl-tRNA synthetase